MVALHEERREIICVFAVYFDFCGDGGRENPGDSAFQFRDDFEFFNAAFAEFGVAHDLSNDAVRPRDLLLDDFDLLGGGILYFRQGTLKREGSVGDDGEGVFNLMGKLGGEAAGGMQLAFADGEFARFLQFAALAFGQCLHAVATEGQQHQHEHMQ